MVPHSCRLRSALQRRGQLVHAAPEGITHAGWRWLVCKTTHHQRFWRHSLSVMVVTRSVRCGSQYLISIRLMPCIFAAKQRQTAVSPQLPNAFAQRMSLQVQHFKHIKGFGG